MDNTTPVVPALHNLPGFHEPFSAMSHLAGALVFLVLGGLLLWRGRGDRVRLLFLGVYACACVLLLTMSGVYHMMVRGGAAHAVFERLDHGAIFVLIAGTFTPTLGMLFTGWARGGQLALIWGAAIAGLVLKVVFLSNLAEWVGLAFYLTLGWMGLFSSLVLWRRYGFTFIQPLVLGGVAYSVGAVTEFQGWPVVVPGTIHGHEVFHVAVLLGVFSHWLFIWQFADGRLAKKGMPAAVAESNSGVPEGLV